MKQLTKLTPYLLTFGVAVLAIFVVFKVAPAKWRSKVVGM